MVIRLVKFSLSGFDFIPMFGISYAVPMELYFN